MDQAVINTMEVLETRPISELLSEVTIKVCWVSDTEANRNGTMITKEVGKEIAASLPGAPVAGFYNKESGDFEEHAERLVFTKSGEIEFEDLITPYGFVSLENPWYQDFMENGKQRTYLLCKAYLWTRQYAEAAQAIGKGQSL